jgi:6-phosphogluconolactonase
VAVLNVEANTDALVQRTAHRIAELLLDAVARSGYARLCLTGGSTPREMYRLLGQPSDDLLRKIEWTRIHLFWGDERHVPPDHPDSNFGMANELLVKPAAIPSAQVHRMCGELPDSAAAAREYDTIVRRYRRPDAPTFDVMLLGLGADAHIASIFPGSPLLDGFRKVEDLATVVAQECTGGASSARAAAVWAAHLNTWRITLTAPAILDSDAILVLTAGAGKAGAVHSALRLAEDVERYPAQLLRAADARVEWWMDRDAAGRL